MLSLFALICCLGSLSVVSAKYDFNCGRENKAPTVFTKGDVSYFCLHFMPYMVKIGFVVRIDEYSGVEVPDIFELFEKKAPEVTNVFGQLDTYPLYSPPSVYMMKSAKQLAPVMHLVINLDNGSLKGFRWENACYGCNKTDGCKEFKTEYENMQDKKESISYKACSMGYPQIADERKYANLKVDCGL